MSSATLIVPKALKTSTFPAALTPTSTRLASTSPADGFTFDVRGKDPPSGYSVSSVPLVGAIAVTFITTALTPDPGRPPRPSTVITRLAPCVMGPLPAPVLLLLH